MPTLQAHKLAEFLPLMSEAELAALKSDIANPKHGQREAAMLFEGKILDGRNRAIVCEQLGIELRTKEFKGDATAAQQYVLSKAMHRNLTDTQKAYAAKNLLLYLKPLGEIRKKAGVPSPVEEGMKGESYELAGKMMGVSGSYVRLAEKLFEADPKLFQKVFNGRPEIRRFKVKDKATGKVTIKERRTKPLTLSQAMRQVRSAQKQKNLTKLAETMPPIGDCNIRCIDAMRGFEAVAPNSVRLIFEDGPYNNGTDYGDGPKADKIPPEKFAQNAFDRFGEAHRVLTADGSLWVMINHENAANFELAITRAGFHIRAWITWYETFGNNCQDNFNRTSRRIFYCVKNPKSFVFDATAFNCKSARQKKYQDARAAKGGKVWDDVWTDIPRLVENDKERLHGFPTQLPLKLVRPIVLGCSEPGDIVIDPYTGTGTTAIAACCNARKFMGFEKQKQFAVAAEQRVKVAVAAAQKKDQLTRTESAHGSKFSSGIESEGSAG